MKKIIKVLKSNSIFFKDATLNVIAFAIYICSQQLFLLPILARLLEDEDYAILIVVINLMNAFCNVLGGQLGVTHQLVKDDYCECKENERGDFFFIMLIASIGMVVCLFAILVFLDLKVIDIVVFCIIAVISNFRLYIRYYFRINSIYKNTIWQNVFYLFGVLCGLPVVKILNIMWLPLLLGEGFACVYTLCVIPMKSIRIRKSNYIKKVIKRYAGLGVADAMTNIVTLVDKLLVYPLLGSYTLAVYNAGSSTSKVTALIMNPLNEVLLVKLSKAKEEGISKLLKVIIITSFLVSAVMFVIFIPIIYVFSYLLYNQYLSDINSIIYLLSIRCSVGITVSIMKSFIIRYAKSSQLAGCYALNLLILGLGGYIGADKAGLFGFAVATVIAQIGLWLSYIVILIMKCGDDE